MCDSLEALKRHVEAEIANLSRQAAHAIGDLEAEVAVVAQKIDARVTQLEDRVGRLEGT